ncbi:MAG: glycosyltransferase family 2 protein [Planctomycetota bacterium]|nr:glycosyltransferase family 2 protein [Planctomycetota bacterium]
MTRETPVQSESSPEVTEDQGCEVGPVTVCVTNFNGAEYLEACLEGVTSLRGRIDDILVIDNGSKDDSVAIIQRYPVRLIQLSSNDGPCVARNRGLLEATTRWVFQIDSDVVVKPDTLEQLWPQTEEEGVAAVQPRAVLRGEPSLVHYDGGSMHYVGMLCLDNFMQPIPAASGEGEDVGAVVSMALLLDRTAVIEVGNYDEAFFILFEDHDLSYRLRACGYRLRRVLGATVDHLGGTAGLSYRPGSRSYPSRRAFLHGRNRTYLVLKNYSLLTLLVTLPGRFLFGTAWAVFSCRRGLALSYLKGRLDVIRLLPRALRARRRLAPQRRLRDGVLLEAESLTFSPIIARSKVEARLEGALTVILRGWWRLVRFLIS